MDTLLCISQIVFQVKDAAPTYIPIICIYRNGVQSCKDSAYGNGIKINGNSIKETWKNTINDKESRQSSIAEPKKKLPLAKKNPIGT